MHGDLEHGYRKINYFAFDKIGENEGGLLICTDVASRGLDFKGVDWIVQYDLSSHIKEYVNRVGRTARIASTGQAICFLMPNELEYVPHMRKQHGITLNEKKRFVLVKHFEKSFHEGNADMKYKFRRLVNIDAPDEQQESLHAIRQYLTALMMDDATGLKSLGTVARSSSTRAYSGHSADMRHIFDTKKLNLTEFARSFGLYKALYMRQPKPRVDAKETASKEIKKPIILDLAHEPDLAETVKQNQTLFSRRL